MTRILIIEDHRDIAEGIAENLEMEGYQVAIASDGRSGLAAFESEKPDLLILDLMLPDISGFDILHDIRERGSNIPVLILSARSEEVEKVRGFRAGADDYVTKPFGLLELMMRVEALTRRFRLENVNKRAKFGSIEIDYLSRQVFVEGREVALRPREFDLLSALSKRPNQALSRDQLLEEVWDYDPEVESRTVDWHVAELRRKLERDPAKPSHIITVRKVGYRFDSEAGDQS